MKTEGQQPTKAGRQLNHYTNIEGDRNTCSIQNKSRHTPE